MNELTGLSTASSQFFRSIAMSHKTKKGQPGSESYPERSSFLLYQEEVRYSRLGPATPDLSFTAGRMA